MAKFFPHSSKYCEGIVRTVKRGFMLHRLYGFLSEREGVCSESGTTLSSQLQICPGLFQPFISSTFSAVKGVFEIVSDNVVVDNSGI